MKRFKIVGLCLVAVFALSAVMASGASAGQFGKCVKAEKVGKAYTGQFTDKYCSVLSSPVNTGKYKWEGYKGAAIKTFSEGGESKLKGAAGEIVCKHGTDTGEILNATENREVFTFYECSLKPFELPCKNAEVEIEEGKGKSAKKVKVGVIVTYKLKTKLLDHGEKGPSGGEPKVGEVWNVISPEGENPSFVGPGFWLAAFECGPVPFAVTGSVSGVMNAAHVDGKLKKGKPGKNGKEGKATYVENYTATGGEQDLVTTYFNPETSAVEAGASIQEGTNNVGIESLEKGFEISSLGL